MVIAPIRRLRERRELAAARRHADEQLALSTLPSPRLAWRTNELCSEDNRRALAGSIVDVLRAAQGRYLPSASPLNRGAARREAELLLRIAARLEDVSRPVRPRGVILVDRLLTDGAGPLYARDRERRLHTALQDALLALDGTS
jgi:hypothetical protein